MKVLLVAPASNLSGSSKSMVTILKSVSAYEVNFSVLLPSSGKITLQISQEHNVLIGNYKPLKIGFFSIIEYIVGQLIGVINLIRAVRVTKPDLIHVNSLTIVFPGIVSKLIGIPVLYHVRETPDFYNRFVWALYKKNIKVFASGIVSCADSVLAPFVNLKNVNLYSVHNWVTPEYILNDFSQIEKSSNGRSLVIGSFASTGSRKGLTELIDSFNLVQSFYEHVVLRITEEKPAFEWFLRNFGDSADEVYSKSSIEFAGQQTDVISFLDGCDVFVTPSYAEALPRSVLEAMSRGLCVIATSVGGTGEIIRNAEDGYLVEPGDIDEIARIIISLINDRQQLLRVRRNAVARIVDKFSNAQAKKLFECYKSIVAC